MSDCVRCHHQEDWHRWVKEIPRRKKPGEPDEPTKPKRGACGARGCPCKEFSSGAEAEEPKGLDPRLGRFKFKKEHKEFLDETAEAVSHLMD